MTDISQVEKWVENMAEKMKVFLWEGEKSMIVTEEDLNKILQRSMK